MNLHGNGAFRGIPFGGLFRVLEISHQVPVQAELDASRFPLDTDLDVLPLTRRELLHPFLIVQYSALRPGKIDRSDLAPFPVVQGNLMALPRLSYTQEDPAVYRVVDIDLQPQNIVSILSSRDQETPPSGWVLVSGDGTLNHLPAATDVILR